MKFDYDKIDRYIQKQLPEDEQKAFEIEVAKDTTLAKEVKSRKEVIFYAKLMGQRKRKEELKAMVKEGLGDKIENEKPKDDQKKPNPYFRYAAIAASIAALIVTYIIYIKKIKPVSLSPLVAKNYSPYDIGNIHSSSEDTKTIQQQADSLYNKKKYTEVILKLEQLTESNSQYRLMGGIAYFENRQYDKAIEQFNLIIKDEENNYSDHAKWYAALTYLQIDNKPKAKQLLQELLIETSYSKEAQQLLEEIKLSNNRRIPDDITIQAIEEIPEMID